MAKRMYMNLRDNFGRFQRFATVNLTKQLQQVADTTGNNIREDLAKTLKEKYKENVLASYGPREGSAGFGYEHENLFYDHIEVKVEQDKVQIVVEEANYPNGKSTLEVHDYLTYGTTPDNTKKQEYRFQGDNGNWYTAKNYETPIHPFEDHTMNQMRAYIDSITSDVKNKKYSKK